MPDPEILEGGPIRHVTFAGILQGRVGDASGIEAVVSELNRLGLARADLEVEGGRFTLLFDDRVVPGSRATPDVLARLATLLGDLVERSSEPEEAEATLRCTLVRDQEVVETLFVPKDGRVQAFSRIRPIEGGDIPPRDPDHLQVAFARMGRKRAILVLGLLVLVFGIAAWQSGYVDRLFSHSAEELRRDTGPFGDTLAIDLDKAWGNYQVTLTRGPDFPVDVKEFDRRREETTDLTRRAALAILAEGGRIYVQLLDAKDEVIHSAEVELRPLVSREDAKVELKVPGRLAADGFRLSLERGLER